MEKTSNSGIGRSLASVETERLLTAFFVLYKTARILDPSNATFKNQLGSFMKHLVEIGSRQGDVSIKRISGHYFVNEEMVQFDDKGLSGAADVIADWERLGIGGVRFSPDILSDEAGKFFTFMATIRPDDTNLDRLSSQLTEHGFSQVLLLSAIPEKSDESAPGEETRREFRRAARQTFFRAMNAVKDIIVGPQTDRDLNAARTKRVVHSLIDQIMRDEQSMIELTAIRDYDDYTYAHSVNVTVYALTLGIRLGLDRARLSQLGFAGLFHDVGKVKLPTDLVRKPDAFDENDWLQMQRHPLLGAKTILRNMKLDIHTARAARVAFEHHINNDLTGYPRLRLKQVTPNLFSRIISVVDSFDALVSGRIYIKKSIPPDQVFKKMQYQMSEKFDPFLLKLFNDIVGIYPPGTLVLLNTDEIALVLTNNSHDPARPYVKIIGNRQGLLEEPIWVDLTIPEREDCKITRQIDPARYGLNARDFILED